MTGPDDLQRLARRAAAGDLAAARRLVAALEAKAPDETLPAVPEIARMAVETIRRLADAEDLEDWLAKAGTPGSRRVTGLIENAILAAESVARGRYEKFVARAVLSGDPEGGRIVGDLEPDIRIEFRSDLVQLRVERFVRRILRSPS